MLWLVFIVVLAVYPARAFYPYELASPWLGNGVQQSASGELSFVSPGVALVQHKAAWSDTVKLWMRVTPASIEPGVNARILSHGSNFWLRNYAIVQRGRDLLVLVRGHYGYVAERGWRVPDVFVAGRPTVLMVDLAAREATITVEGRAAQRHPMPAPLGTYWVGSAQLRLGNEAGLNRPWLGRIEVAVWQADGAPEDLLRHRHLLIPRPMRAFHNPPDWIPFARGFAPAMVRDYVENLFGFVPLGFILVLVLRGRSRHAPGLALLLGCALSASIESLQWLMPRRFVSVSDWVLNTLGTAVGVVCAIVAIRVWQRCRARAGYVVTGGQPTP